MLAQVYQVLGRQCFHRPLLLPRSYIMHHLIHLLIGLGLSSQEHGQQCSTWAQSTFCRMCLFARAHSRSLPHSGYLESCRTIVTCARTIANTIETSIPELYILGSPPASVIAFASKHPAVNVLEVGDAMAQRGWHLNALSKPAAVHIACTVRTCSHSDPAFTR